MGVFDQVRSDLRMMGSLARALPAAARYRPGVEHTVCDAFEKVIEERADAVALIDADDGGRRVTFGQIGRHAARVAHWALNQGVDRGDVVALLMPNRPEYLSTWLGLARVGAVTALINTNLTGDALAHSIAVSQARHLIVERELAPAWQNARPDDAPTVEEWHTGAPPADAPAVDGAHVHDLDAALAALPPTPVDRSLRDGMTTRDPLFYIYTSGTTGLPKAARFSHGKFLLVSGLGPSLGIRRDDRMYIPLPLYHTAGGVMALGGPLLVGGSAILARKFSASRFWDHCHEHGATVFQYIGELCRYLLNSPPHPHERDHELRLAVGNGLRPDVWPAFQERFAIPRIVEFYGATEGTGSLVNLDNKVGAIGRLRPQVAAMMGFHLVEFDVDTEEIRRDENGRVIRVKVGEPGEAITRISDFVPFDGYSDADATEKKIVRDAFKDGDTWFRTGDLLRQDSDGYYYFVDRVGDTFRWKAENVSTAEVAAVVGEAPGVLEANIYGVEVPGHDGRAGMAAIVVDERFDPAVLHRHVAANLASYARPLFLRLRDEVEITTTFKHRKRELVTEGFDPGAIADPLLFRDTEADGYVPLSAELYERIVTGDIRV
jgi:fatty-acyl-CoA synthase